MMDELGEAFADAPFPISLSLSVDRLQGVMPELKLSPRMNNLRESIADVPPADIPKLQIDALPSVHRQASFGKSGQCNKPRCGNKIWWSALDSGPICFKHTVRKLSLNGIRTDLNRNTYVCRLNKMHLREIVDHLPELKAHYQWCPRECRVMSCPRLIGIPRAP